MTMMHRLTLAICLLIAALCGAGAIAQTTPAQDQAFLSALKTWLGTRSSVAKDASFIFAFKTWETGFFAAAKAGPQGPQGPQGPAGPSGPALGPVGPSGGPLVQLIPHGQGPLGPAYELAQLFVSPLTAVMPAANNIATNWQNAGLASIGGIPTRNTQCGTTLTPIGGGTSDASAIQSRLDSCAAGQFIQLNGSFSVNLADLPLVMHTGITLRGTTCTGSTMANNTPYCATSISVRDGTLAYTGGNCGVSLPGSACPNGSPVLMMYPNSNPATLWSWAQCSNTSGSSSSTGLACGAITLTADAAQGDTTVSVSSTSGFTVGDWVLIDEASNSSFQTDPTGYCASIYGTANVLGSSSSPATSKIIWEQWCPSPGGTDSYCDRYGYCDRMLAELHKISAIGSGTFTFDSPLTIAFRQSGSHNAQIYLGPYYNQSGTGAHGMLQQAGVENLSVLRGPNGNITMQFCVNCWLKNVDSGYWECGALNIEYSARSEIRGSYLHHASRSTNNGCEYPIALDNGSTEMLITNSIINFGGKGLVARGGGAGSVLSYNYIDDTFYDTSSGIGDYFVDMAANASHYTGPHHVLFEGNWSNNCDNDWTHGSNFYHTYYRNQCTGLRTPFTDPDSGNSVNDATGVGWTAAGAPVAPNPLRAAGMMVYNYWHAFVGNVLGLSGTTTTDNGWVYSSTSNSGTGLPTKTMWALGWSTAFINYAYDTNLYPSFTYMFRHGNYDYVNASIVDWQSGYSQSLPNSLYLSSTPSFFGPGASCTYTYPWIDSSASPPVKANSCAGSGNPAKARWDAGTPFVQP